LLTLPFSRRVNKASFAEGMPKIGERPSIKIELGPVIDTQNANPSCSKPGPGSDDNKLGRHHILFKVIARRMGRVNESKRGSSKSVVVRFKHEWVCLKLREHELRRRSNIHCAWKARGERSLNITSSAKGPPRGMKLDVILAPGSVSRYN